MESYSAMCAFPSDNTEALRYALYFCEDVLPYLSSRVQLYAESVTLTYPCYCCITRSEGFFPDDESIPDSVSVNSADGDYVSIYYTTIWWAKLHPTDINAWEYFIGQFNTDYIPTDMWEEIKPVFSEVKKLTENEMLDDDFLVFASSEERQGVLYFHDWMLKKTNLCEDVVRLILTY